MRGASLRYLRRNLNRASRLERKGASQTLRCPFYSRRWDRKHYDPRALPFKKHPHLSQAGLRVNPRESHLLPPASCSRLSGPEGRRYFPRPRLLPHKAARPQLRPIGGLILGHGPESQWKVAARAELPLFLTGPLPSACRLPLSPWRRK